MAALVFIWATYSRRTVSEHLQTNVILSNAKDDTLVRSQEFSQFMVRAQYRQRRHRQFAMTTAFALPCKAMALDQLPPSIDAVFQASLARSKARSGCWLAYY